MQFPLVAMNKRMIEIEMFSSSARNIFAYDHVSIKLMKLHDNVVPIISYLS